MIGMSNGMNGDHTIHGNQNYTEQYAKINQNSYQHGHQ
jgi:hypothetical protein